MLISTLPRLAEFGRVYWWYCISSEHSIVTYRNAEISKQLHQNEVASLSKNHKLLKYPDVKELLSVNFWKRFHHSLPFYLSSWVCLCEYVRTSGEGGGKIVIFFLFLFLSSHWIWSCLFNLMQENLYNINFFFLLCFVFLFFTSSVCTGSNKPF